MRSILKAILFSVLFTVGLIATSYVANLFPEDLERLAYGILGSVTALLVTLAFIRFDQHKLIDIGLKPGGRTVVNFTGGFVTGLLIMGSLAYAVMYFSAVRVELNPTFNFWIFLLMVIQIFFLALMEEIGFRGYSLVLLRNTIGIRPSIFITSVLFALYHIANGWSIASSFYGPAVWGLVFALAAIYTKGIAAPTGLHFAANLTTSSFGEPGNSNSRWIMESTGIQSVKADGIHWETILPSISLLVFAIICIEYFIRRKVSAV